MNTAEFRFSTQETGSMARSIAVQITLSFIWALDYGTKIKFKLFPER